MRQGREAEEREDEGRSRTREDGRRTAAEGRRGGKWRESGYDSIKPESAERRDQPIKAFKGNSTVVKATLMSRAGICSPFSAI